MKPILFNTEMVQAILDGRKTVTRRVVKEKYSNTHLEMFTNKYGTRLIELQNDVEGETHGKNVDDSTWHKLLAMREVEYEYKPYQVGDILYVRETFSFQGCETCQTACLSCIPECYKNEEGCFIYRTNYGSTEDDTFPPSIYKWKPSIHMPRDAARIFLKVTNVRVERLQDIDADNCLKEGIDLREVKKYKDILPVDANDTTSLNHLVFRNLWDNTIKDDRYMYYKNPWVWVIEFERLNTNNY